MTKNEPSLHNLKRSFAYIKYTLSFLRELSISTASFRMKSDFRSI